MTCTPLFPSLGVSSKSSSDPEGQEVLWSLQREGLIEKALGTLGCFWKRHCRDKPTNESPDYILALV